MKAKPKVVDDGRTVTVRVPISIRRRGGRKLVLGPDGACLTGVPIHRRVDNAMVKAIARAFRWREMLESGKYSTIREIAGDEQINESYVGRVLRLTLLAPDIVEAILSGRQPAGLQLDCLLRRLPVGWDQQEAMVHIRKHVGTRLGDCSEASPSATRSEIKARSRGPTPPMQLSSSSDQGPCTDVADHTYFF